MKELVVLIDSDDNEIGQGEKLETHRRGLLHRGVSTLVHDLDGRLLIHKRSRHKYHSPGLWTAPCCGHPRPGETYEEAARRRIKEEMGIDCAFKKAYDGLYRVELGEYVEHEYGWVMESVVNSDALVIRPDEDEVEDYAWVHRAVLERNIACHPQKYTYWFRLMMKKNSEHLLRRAELFSKAAG